MNNDSKRVALITGGSRGLGLGIAQQLAERDFNLAINGRRDEQSVTEVLQQLRDSSTEVIYCQADVADAASREAMVDQVRDAFGRLDVLINNAGVAPTVRADILEATQESFDRLIDINLKGPYFLTQAVANWMIEQRREDSSFAGIVINVSSANASLASVNRGEYCISKAGMSMATQLWAVRLAEFGIAVYEVRPGIFHTDMNDAVTEKYDQLIAEGLLLDPRWGRPEELGKAVAVLASGELSYATGNVLNIDGGMTVPRL